MTQAHMITRRRFGLMAAAASLTVAPRAAVGAAFREITWEDLIPPGEPYSEIVGDGKFDAVNDVWAPEFDEHGAKLNPELDGALVKLPGYIIPLEMGAEGVTDFVLVPYVGACIHVPPPPPNQLVLVSAKDPWPSESLWDAVWVSGRMTAQLASTEVAQTGYRIEAEKVEAYQW